MSNRIFKLNLGIGKGDCKEFDFESKQELADFVFELKAFDCIWICTGHGEHAELLVTDDIMVMIDMIKSENEYFFDGVDEEFIFIQEYESFESAYAVALDMREGHPKCYDTK